MKRNNIAAALAGMLALAQTGCGGSGITAGTTAKNLGAEIVAAQVTGADPDDTFVTAQTAFSLNLLQYELNTKRGKNVLISPYSVMQALAMTANGAAGDTRTEMEQALGGIPVESLNPYLYTQRIAQPHDEKCRLNTANSVWIRDDGERIQVDPAFLQTNADYYDAQAYRAPFDESTVREINAWGSQHTDGMIPQILDSIPPEAVMYLINAVVFDAKWARKYDADDLVDRKFTTFSGTEADVQMMFSDEGTYLSDENADGFLRSYEGGRYAFAALLPHKGLTAEDYAAALTPAHLLDVLQNRETCKVRAGIPQFSFDFSDELSSAMQSMGMELAFTGAADFSGMGRTDTGSLFISRILHKTHIDVDTEGTKAAAITAVEMNDENCVEEPEEVRYVILDRPFVFMILDTQTNLPVFTGVLNDPSQN